MATVLGRKRAREEIERQVGVTHATLDPGGPGVARLHLVPPKVSSRGKQPSILFINGWHILPVGSSWAALLRTFMEVLNERANPGEEIGDEEMVKILDLVVLKMKKLYRVSKERLVDDLDELLAIIMAVAHGQPVPEGLQTAMTLGEYTDNMTAPHRMDLIISPMTLNGIWQCPLHCQNCYAAGQPGMMINHQLTTVGWKEVIDRCREAGIPQLTFTGGEPTVRQDLVELVDYASWHITRLNTNGVMITAELAKSLSEASLDGIQLTLYSYDSEVHDKLVGKKGGWQFTVEGIKNALAAGLSVSINTPLVEANVDYSETLEFIHKMGIRYATCSGLIPTGAASKQIEQNEILSNQRLYLALATALDTAKNLGIEVSFTSPGWLTSEQLESLGLLNPICGACLSNMAVMPNGAVAPCQSWLDNPQGLGNILDIPWEEIWNHPDCKRIRETAAMSDNCPLGGK
jgi:MoaA/NifB/PqqE/SkfB family radical SAM enzyme